MHLTVLPLTYVRATRGEIRSFAGPDDAVTCPVYSDFPVAARRRDRCSATRALVGAAAAALDVVLSEQGLRDWVAARALRSRLRVAPCRAENLHLMLEHHIRWMADAQSIEFVGSQRTGVGTVFNCVTRIGPFVTHDLLAITEWEHMARIGVQHKGEVRRGLSRQGVRCGSMEPWPVMFSAVS